MDFSHDEIIDEFDSPESLSFHEWLVLENKYNELIRLENPRYSTKWKTMNYSCFEDYIEDSFDGWDCLENWVKMRNQYQHDYGFID